MTSREALQGDFDYAVDQLTGETRQRKKGLVVNAATVAASSLLAIVAAGAKPAGAIENNASRSVIPAQSKMFGVFESSRVDLVAEAGFQYIEKDLWVTPGQKNFNDLSENEQNDFINYMREARNNGLKVVLNLWQVGWPHGPKRLQYPPPSHPSQWRDMCDVGIGAIKHEQADAEALGQESAITAFILGVEPNADYFWSDQKNAPAQDENWTADCFDKFQQELPDIRFYGGVLASQAGPGGTGPDAFIAGMCQAYEKSGRSGPIMDGFAMHSYEDSPPDTTHPNTDVVTIGDSQKLENDLSCFKQGRIGILWNEVGYESTIPSWQAYRYTGHEDSATLSEQQQGDYYGDVMDMAFCDPDSDGVFLFHMDDDPNLKQWQSGLYFANPPEKMGAGRTTSEQEEHPDAAKQSLPIVETELARIQSDPGSISCK